MTNNSMEVRKEYKRPSLRVVELGSVDIIATSGTGGSMDGGGGYGNPEDE